jgi:hypothetical protein
MREVNIGAPHEAEGQTCRGFIRDRHHVSHGVFLIKHAPQTYAAIYDQSSIVKSGQNRSILADMLPTQTHISNLKQSLCGVRLLALSPGLLWPASLSASGEGAAE